MKRDGGFSLIELIVVIGMIAALTGILVPNMMTKYSTEARACARRVDEMLSEARIKQMSRAGAYRVAFYNKADGVYGRFLDSSRPEDKLGGAALQLLKEDDSKMADGEANGVTFAFDRSTGKLKTSSLTPTAGTVEYVFRVSSLTRTYTITVNGLTGRHEVTTP